MAIVIQPYRPEHEPAVADFNQRLRQAGEDEGLVFYRWAQPRWLPRTAESRIYNEFFVAVDGGIVRGGYALKSQEFFFPDGEIRSIGYYHHPLSEGIVNKAHAMVGALLLRDAMQRAPLLYCLGMGGYERPLPQMLVRLGWTNCLMPFFFRVVNPSRFLRNMQILRSSPSRKFVMNLVAHTGAGWAGSKLFQAYRALRAPRSQEADCCQVAGFDGGARCRGFAHFVSSGRNASHAHCHEAQWHRERMGSRGRTPQGREIQEHARRVGGRLLRASRRYVFGCAMRHSDTRAARI